MPEDFLEDKIDNEKSYRQLLVSIKASQGILSVLVAVCDDINFRESLIRRYEGELEKWNIRPYRLRLARGEPSLRSAIANQVEIDEYLQQRGRSVLTVVGAEDLSFLSRNSERSEQDKFFGYLQWTREGLRAFPFPIVLWITNDIFGKINRRAPDFWSWRKGVFRFEAIKVSLVAVTGSIAVIGEDVSKDSSLSNFNQNDFLLSLEDLQGLIEQTRSRNGDKDPKLAGLYSRIAQVYEARLDRGESEDYRKERELAIAYLYQAIELQKEFGLKFDLVGSLNRVGLIFQVEGRFKEAIELHREALAISQEIRDRQGEATSYRGLGNAYSSLRKYQQAIHFYQQSLEISQEIGDRRGDASSLNGLGNAYSSLGEYQQAIQFHQQSLEIEREIGNCQGEASSLTNLGIVYQSLRQYQQAIQFHQQSLEISQEIGDLQGEANSLGNLGNVYDSLGEYQQAIKFHQQSLEIARQIGDRRSEAISLNNLGNAHNSLEKYQQAIQFHQQSLELAQEIRDCEIKYADLCNIGNCHRFLKEYPQAINYYQQALVILREKCDRKGEANILQCLAASYYQTGKIKEAFAAASQAVQILMEIATSLDDYPFPKWIKSAIKFAQRGKWQIALCFVAGLMAFPLVPFVIVAFVALTIWRLIHPKLNRH
ncbi:MULTISPECIES: tetratricopeptide repeat protein [Kamptonema]|uniref:tetratricopeptide repeat protein n=1 Tax=Kamptonema TaxID=1501433 RepID=UPI0001DAD064|nr:MULTISPECIES: tetratricopeptide repeat protein [Kamptonema]CBN56442.1 putative Similar to tr/Q110T7/Q110T7_TRIEI Tetratricopeptide TPR_2 [Kamptonema sp. PCC 6506]